MEQPVTVPNVSDDDRGIYGPPETQVVLELLRSWEDDDPEEQRATWEYLKEALDEDRLGARKLFP